MKIFHLLKMALELCDMLIDNLDNNEVYIVNKMQIKKRMNELTDDDRKQLIRLKLLGDNVLSCCILVILEQWDDFEVYFETLSDETKNDFKMWPIYKLYEEYKLSY